MSCHTLLLNKQMLSTVHRKGAHRKVRWGYPRGNSEHVYTLCTFSIWNETNSM